MSTPEPVVFAGVDVGAGRADAALVSCSPASCSPASCSGGVACVFGGLFAGSVDDLAGFCRDAARVMVDAPGGLSAGAHRADASVAPKFRSGRCSEIPVPGVPPVPWVTPSVLSESPGWMRTGFDIWDALAAHGLDVVETFPAAVFHRLNGRRWPPRKSTPAGVSARLSLLSRVISLPASASGWTHDQVDAVACAVVAALGQPAGHSCERPDGSVMWVLP